MVDRSEIDLGVSRAEPMAAMMAVMKAEMWVLTDVKRAELMAVMTDLSWESLSSGMTDG